jgi:hypothetical protein
MHEMWEFAAEVSRFRAKSAAAAKEPKYRPDCVKNSINALFCSVFAWLDLLPRLVEPGTTQKVTAGAADQLAAAVFKARGTGRAVDRVVFRTALSSLRWAEHHKKSLIHSCFVKGTASAVPQMSDLERGFSP